jgi:Arc/MetJ-type ribon-helix-helix transcriptional regulator
MTTEQIAVRIPQELLARLDQLVGRGVYDSRAAAVRAGLEVISEIERQRELDAAIVEGYRRVPPTAEDGNAALASLRDSIVAEPW